MIVPTYHQLGRNSASSSEALRRREDLAPTISPNLNMTDVVEMTYFPATPVQHRFVSVHRIVGFSELRMSLGISAEFSAPDRCRVCLPRDALKRAAIENSRWHDLRHTWASWHVQNGIPLFVLQELGGWESVESASTEMRARFGHSPKIGLLEAPVTQ